MKNAFSIYSKESKKKKLTKYSFGTESNEQKIFTDEMYSSFSYVDIV